jgi:hypothetical protein
LSNEEKTNDYENLEKGMIYMKILKKGGVVEKRGEEETKSMPHAPVVKITFLNLTCKFQSAYIHIVYKTICRMMYFSYLRKN